MVSKLWPTVDFVVVDRYLLGEKYVVKDLVTQKELLVVWLGSQLRQRPDFKKLIINNFGINSILTFFDEIKNKLSEKTLVM